jgi:hypothetical protein
VKATASDAVVDGATREIELEQLDSGDVVLLFGRNPADAVVDRLAHRSGDRECRDISVN